MENLIKNKVIVLYYADWCGHCQNFKPSWEKLKSICSSDSFRSKYKTNVVALEYSNESNETRQKGITRYPTILIDDTLYSGQRDVESIISTLLRDSESTDAYVDVVGEYDAVHSGQRTPLLDSKTANVAGVGENKSDKKQVTLYTADWCGHCQNFKPEWETLKKVLKNPEFCSQYAACDVKEYTDKDAESQSISGFPTIKIGESEYNGIRNIKSILKHLFGTEFTDQDINRYGTGNYRGGGSGSDLYMKKYIKYKNKYFRLKK